MASTYMHLVEYCGETIETTVTNEASIAENWMKNTKSLLDKNGEKYRIIGINCKFIGHPIKSMSNKVALLQLCVGTKCLVLQLQHMDCVSQSIRDFFLCNPSFTFTFVGVETEEMRRMLYNEYGLGMGKGKVLDVRLMAKTWFPMSYRGSLSLKALAYGVAGLSLRKGCCYEGDWEAMVLDDELVERACCDAYASYCIAYRMLKKDF